VFLQNNGALAEHIGLIGHELFAATQEFSLHLIKPGLQVLIVGQ